MAKKKISELEEMYNADGKDIIAFLNGKGIDARTAGSSVDESAQALVAEHFGKKKTEGANQADKGPSEAEKTAPGVHPVKKKKIIIVTGAQKKNRPATSSYSSGQAAGTRAGGTRKRSEGGRGTQQGTYHPIKPKTVPTQMSVDYHKPEQSQPHVVRKVVRTVSSQEPAEESAAKAAEAKAAEAKAAAEVKEKSEAAAAAKTAPVQNGAPEAETVRTAQPAQEKVQSAQAEGTNEQTAVPAAAVKPAPAKAEKTEAETVKENSAAADAAAKKTDRENARTPSAASDKKETASSAERTESAPKKAQSAHTEKAQPAAKAAAETKEERKPRVIAPHVIKTVSFSEAVKAASEAQEARRDAAPVKRENIYDMMRARKQAEAKNGQSQSGRGTAGRRPGGTGRPGQGSRIRMNDSARNNAQGGFNRGGQGGYNRGGQGGFSGRGGQGQGSFGRGQGQGGRRGGAPTGEGGASFGDNRRRSNQFKDKRNKKDFAYTEADEREKQHRSGKFIKPAVEEKAEPEEQIKVITIPEKLTIGELAEAMHMKPAELIKKLFLAGKMMTVNSELTYEEAEDIAADYDILCEKEKKVDVIEELLREDKEDEKDMVPRPPVICVMGHVDHGKTSILDYIRHTHVTKKEAGGITQAIGAYTVKTKSGRTITFLDTPGHEAFTAMRLRGAQSTDIAVLVVAADDGVMPQTVEAINHAKAAGVEVIVAINKIDKPNANPQRVKEQLSKYELIPTDWGGSTEFVEVSAKTGQGIEDLLETIILQADVMELKANPNRLARGIVLEARLDKGRGPVANVLVQKGTLHVGDFVSAGPAFGKVRALIDDKGDNVKDAGPSMPVMVMGLSDVPSAGEVILAHATNDEARQFAETYKTQHKEELVEENRMSMNVEDLFDQMREGKMKELELIVKADVQGSVEALCQSLLKLSNDEVVVKIIHSAVGNITESDVTLAAASNAAIIGFNVHPDATAKGIAEHDGVSIHLYKVIYQAIDDVDAALKGMLAPVYEEKIIGHAQVRQIFKSGKIGNIAGCMVLDGVIEKDCSVRITRGSEKIFEGDLDSLKRFKDDVKEVKAGYDCGMVFKDFDAINVEDNIEAYKMVEVPREEVEKRKAAEAKKAADDQQ